MAKKKDVEPKNKKGEYHGYQEWYGYDRKDAIWVRGYFRYDVEVGYLEDHGIKQTFFYII